MGQADIVSRFGGESHRLYEDLCALQESDIIIMLIQIRQSSVKYEYVEFQDFLFIYLFLHHMRWSEGGTVGHFS